MDRGSVLAQQNLSGTRVNVWSTDPVERMGIAADGEG